MSDTGPPENVQAVKKKRRVKKKTARAAQEAAPAVVVERPTKKEPLTTYDREVYDYVRELTSKNVWYAHLSEYSLLAACCLVTDAEFYDRSEQGLQSSNIHVDILGIAGMDR